MRKFLKSFRSNREFTELGLPEEYHRRLERGGITTVAELAAKTEEELYQIRSVGRGTIKAIQRALVGKGLAMGLSAMPRSVACICSGRPAMEVMMADRRGEIWECPNCARLLYRSKVSAVQKWYADIGLEEVMS